MKIPQSVVDEFIAHAQELAPIESCGYLAGDSTGVSRYIRMTNVDASSDHFTFDPKEQFQAMKSARALGEKLVGVVHSHPVTPARLSAEDIRLFNDPSMAYLIVSLRDAIPSFNAFSLRKPEPGVVEISPIQIAVTS